MLEEESQPVSTNSEPNDVLEKLLQPEVQQALVTLIDQLPKLTEIVNIMTKSYDFAHSVATDDVLKSDTVEAITEVVGPVKESVKNMAANVIEAKERAEVSQEAIGVFGLLKMLKDPQAQKMFRFVNAYLQVSEERSKK
ncbi:helical membrane plugin domain-containing protein [Paenibacillus sp. CMAA1364]